MQSSGVVLVVDDVLIFEISREISELLGVRTFREEKVGGLAI